MRIVIAGVSGCGKSTVGALLAERLGCGFADADDFHPPENIAKMRAGIPLDDADRAGWLDALGHFLAGETAVILACSALKRVYRDRLRALGGPLHFVVLTLEKDELVARMKSRDHFMPASLLDSQLATLELGDDVDVIPNHGDIAEVAAAVAALLGMPRPPASRNRTSDVVVPEAGENRADPGRR
jgi:carbohydrate kinase (thermoresistant glucokinase family)